MVYRLINSFQYHDLKILNFHLSYRRWFIFISFELVKKLVQKIIMNRITFNVLKILYNDTLSNNLLSEPHLSTI